MERHEPTALIFETEAEGNTPLFVLISITELSPIRMSS
jgi:hypothetical protein